MRRFTLAVLLVVIAIPAYATARTWTGLGADNHWSTPNNWNPVGVPVAGDSLTGPSGASVLAMVNDLGPIALSGVTLNDAYTVSGNAIHSNISGYQATFNVPVFAQGDFTLAVAHVAQLDPNGHRITWSTGTIGALVGTGVFTPDPSAPPLTWTGVHSFSGTIQTGDISLGYDPVILDGATMSAYFMIGGRGLEGNGQIGAFQGAGGLTPYTGSNPIGTIAMGSLYFTGHNLPEEMGR